MGTSEDAGFPFPRVASGVQKAEAGQSGVPAATEPVPACIDGVATEDAASDNERIVSWAPSDPLRELITGPLLSRFPERMLY